MAAARGAEGGLGRGGRGRTDGGARGGRDPRVDRLAAAAAGGGAAATAVTSALSDTDAMMCAFSASARAASPLPADELGRGGNLTERSCGGRPSTGGVDLGL